MGDEQERMAERMALVMTARQAVIQALDDGQEKYPANKWRSLPEEVHQEHALDHILEGSSRDLQHAICRLVFILEMRLSSSQQP